MKGGGGGVEGLNGGDDDEDINNFLHGRDGSGCRGGCGGIYVNSEVSYDNTYKYKDSARQAAIPAAPQDERKRATSGHALLYHDIGIILTRSRIHILRNCNEYPQRRSSMLDLSRRGAR